MSKDPIDSETLAAFLEGRLEPHERAALLERLARDPDAYETFVEAAAIERELAGIAHDDAGASGGAPEDAEKFRPLKDRTPWRYAIPLAAAAGIGALLVGRALLRPSAPPVLLADASALLAASRAATLESALGANWTEPAWTGTRGTATELSEGQRAFRLGSRLAVLALATDAGDPDAAQRAAIELRELFSAVDGGAPVAARLDNLAGGVGSGGPSGGASAALRDIVSALEALVPGVWLRTGAWVEQARLTARAGAVRWFAPDGPAADELRALVAALRSDSAPTAPSTAARLDAVRAAVTTGLDQQALAGLIPTLDAIAEEAAGR